MQITDAEWEVMESVWQADNQLPAEILARIDKGGRSHRTLRTLLARLVDKAAVKVRVDGAKHLYSAAVSRQDCVRTAGKSFKERFFSGSVRALLLHFVEQENLSPEEVDELRRLLASKAQRAERKRVAPSEKSPRRRGTK